MKCVIEEVKGRRGNLITIHSQHGAHHSCDIKTNKQKKQQVNLKSLMYTFMNEHVYFLTDACLRACMNISICE